ncbi:putative ribonuclease H-like domain-containing protein [Tanacetum coccineum]
MNKLVKGNLVRGLPSKLFENDQKGKQHRASCTQSNVTSTKASDNAIQARKATEPDKNYILLPLWTVDPPYSQNLKSSHDDGSKPSSDDEKKVDEDPRKESECNDQENEDNVNNANNVNVDGTNEANAVGGKTSIELPFDLNMPALEDYNIFDFSRNDEDDGAEADMNNLDTTIQVSPNPTTRIHKDHPLDQVIRDLQSATQTRNMLKNLKEHGLVGTIQQRTNHKDLQNFFAFLYGKIEEDVYVCQPLRFEDPNFPDRVYKVEKALYELHQAPRAWYETLSTYLLDNRFQRGKIDKTLIIKRHKVKQKKDGIFISQDKYVEEILKKFKFTDVKTTSTPIETQKPLLKDEDGEEVDVHMYRYQVNPKCKKQTVVANSITEAEYVVASSCCGQMLWIQNQLLDYGDCNEKKLIQMVKIHTDKNVTELLTKAFDAKTINGEAQLHALVDGKKIIITKSTVRRDLQLEDAEDEVVHKELGDSLVRAATTASSLEAEQDSDEEITLVSVQDDANKEMFDVDALNGEEVFVAGQNENVVEEVVDAAQDDIQAKIDADHQLAERLQAQEQEELSDAENATLFQQLLEKKRKHFAAKRAQERRNKHQAKAHREKIMCTDLKNMEGYKLKYLKSKGFDSIQEMFDRAFKRNAKKKKVEDDKETTELKQCLEIIPDEEEVTIDAIPLAVKSLSIVGWKIHKEGTKSYYQIIRADGKSQMYMIFSHMLKSFSREDLEDLYKLVKAKYKSTRPVEDLDLLLLGDLKTMFEPHVEDTVWRNQQDYKVLDWKLYDSCGVHSLRMQHVHIHMLVEKKYPLIPSTLSMMLEKKLQIDYESEMIKSLLDAVRITATHVCVNAAQLELILLVMI